MRPSEWLGVPALPRPASERRLAWFVAASVAVHGAIVLALPPPEDARALLPPAAAAAYARAAPAPVAEDGASGAAGRSATSAPAAGAAMPAMRLAGGTPPPAASAEAAGPGLLAALSTRALAAVTGEADLAAGLARATQGGVAVAEPVGGFGNALSGGGAPPTTIGLGRYGTIGAGGYGIGSGHRGGYRWTPPPSEPTVETRRHEVTCTGCDAKAIARQFRTCGSAIRRCRDRTGRTAPGGRRITVELVVLPTGAIVDVVIRGAADELRECLLDHYRAMSLRAPGEALAVTIEILIREPR